MTGKGTEGRTATQHSAEEAISKVIRGLSEQVKTCIRSLMWMKGLDVGHVPVIPALKKRGQGDFEPS